MPKVKQASTFPASAQFLRKRWAESHQSLALIAKALGETLDKTSECSANLFNLLHLLHRDWNQTPSRENVRRIEKQWLKNYARD